MVARTLAGLFIVFAVITLGYLAVFPITRSAMRTPLQADIHQQSALHPARTPASRVLILGNIITAMVYVVVYGFAAGAFN
jgi:hypothetical protein